MSILPLTRELEPYSSLITDSLEASLSVQQCAERLQPLGFSQYTSDGSVSGSELLEAIKDITLQAAWSGNEHIRNQEMTIEMIQVVIMGERPGRKMLVLLISVFDAVINVKRPTKNLIDTLQAVINGFRVDYPTFLTWLPVKYLDYIEHHLRSSALGAP